MEVLLGATGPIITVVAFGTLHLPVSSIDVRFHLVGASTDVISDGCPGNSITGSVRYECCIDG